MMRPLKMKSMAETMTIGRKMGSPIVHATTRKGMVIAITGKNAIATSKPTYLFTISGSVMPTICSTLRYIGSTT